MATSDISPDPGQLLQRPEDGCAFVIFGASGDLTKRKLIPALYNLFCQDLLPPGFAAVGFAVTPIAACRLPAADGAERQAVGGCPGISPEVMG